MIGAGDAALLRACLAADDELERRLREWERAVALDAVTGDAVAVLPYLHQRVIAARVVPRDAGRIKGIYARAWVVDERAGGVASALSRFRVPTVLLRGAAVRTLAYGVGPGRSVDDTVQLSGRVEDASVPGPPSRDRFADSTGDPAVMTRALASSVPLGSGPARTPAPAYHLLDALLRRTGWFPHIGVQPLLDAGLIAARLAPGDWDVFVDEATRCGWGPLLATGLADLVSVGGAVPADVSARIAGLPAGAGVRLLMLGARQSGRRRTAARGAFGWYLADPDRAHGLAVCTDYPVRNGRHLIAGLRRRRRGTAAD